MHMKPEGLNSLEQEVIISEGVVRLNGIFALPEKARGMIIFAHGSGSGRFSSRNLFVARQLQNAQFGTLLMDLLSETESMNRDNIFDIGLLADRLTLAKRWILNQPEAAHLKIGYFGASTGAGAALVAAAIDPSHLFAIVSRGGRPDLANQFLAEVLSPTLLIVGGDDDFVIDLNLKALQHLACTKELKIIPGATHLFEEPGKLEAVARFAKEWFTKYIS